MWLRGIMVVIKAVLFDLGGTLIKTAPVPIIFERILLSHGIQAQGNIDELFLTKLPKKWFMITGYLTESFGAFTMEKF